MRPPDRAPAAGQNIYRAFNTSAHLRYGDNGLEPEIWERYFILVSFSGYNSEGQKLTDRMKG